MLDSFVNRPSMVGGGRAVNEEMHIRSWIYEPG